MHISVGQIYQPPARPARMAPKPPEQEFDPVVDPLQDYHSSLDRVTNDVLKAMAQAGGASKATFADGSKLLVEREQRSGKITSARIERDGQEVAGLELTHGESAPNAKQWANCAALSAVLVGGFCGLALGTVVPGLVVGGVLATVAGASWLKKELGGPDTIEYRANGRCAEQPCQSRYLDPEELARQQKLHELGWQISDRSSVKLIERYYGADG